MDKIKDNIYFYIAILFIFMLSAYAGLADLDYYWQVELGKAIVTEGNFNKIYDLTWGSLGVSEYYDHEWLTNILFYLFSLLGEKGIFFLKLAISFFVGIITCIFISELEQNNVIGFVQRVEIIAVCLTISLVFIKVKAYSISIIFLMLEIIILERYSKYYRYSTALWLRCVPEDYRSTTRYLLYMMILTILWTNMHSGSLPLLFIVAGIYWIVNRREIKYLIYGIICCFCTLINPYGYKLLLFNFKHNFDDTMKLVVQDWKSINANEAYGVVCAFIILLLVYNLIREKNNNMFVILCSFLFLYLSLCSARHVIYLFPFVLIAISEHHIRSNIRSDFMYVSLFFVSLCVVTCMSSYNDDNFSENYAMNFVTDDLVQVLKETNSDSCEGLCAFDVNIWSEGLQTFTSGAYPLSKTRTNDVYIMATYGSSENISEMIDYYGLTKFCFYKWKSQISYYLLTNTLYDYLDNNDDYVKLYDSDCYCYFVKKDIVNEIE